VQVKDQIEAIARAHDIDASALDSMSATTLVIAIEDHYRVALPDEELATCRSLDDLAGLVARRIA